MQKKIIETTWIACSLIEKNEGQIEGLPANPRLIRDEKFRKLCDSIKEQPEMLSLRELLVFPHNGKYVIIGGNMRFAAMQHLGYTEAPCKIIPADTPVAALKAYTIKDNNGFGDWDWDMLANEWDSQELNDWGLDVWQADDEESGGNGSGEGGDGASADELYTKKIEIPIYPCTNPKPVLSDCFDAEKCNTLIEEIERADISEEEKVFLKIAAYRHCVINFEKVADYYAHSDKKVQELFENNALVLIDFDKAIENGFVLLTKAMREAYSEDYGDDEE